MRKLETDFIHRLFLERTPDTTLDYSMLPSTRAMMLNDLDLISLDRTKKLNMEYDWKRHLVDPKVDDLKGLGSTVSSLTTQHISCQSEPWHTYEDFAQTRSHFDAWREAGRCLKTLDNWQHWTNQRVLRRLKEEGFRVNLKGIDHTVIQQIRCAAASGIILADMTDAQKAEHLTAKGAPSTQNDLKNARRRVEIQPDLLAALLDHCEPSLKALAQEILDHGVT